jgi:hypothetical protein
VAEQLMHGANVGSRLQQVSREAVPQRMTTGGLAELGQLNSAFHCPLQTVLQNMLPSDDATPRIARIVSRREYPLPSPGDTGVRRFHLKRLRQLDTSQIRFAILGEKSTQSLDV